MKKDTNRREGLPLVWWFLGVFLGAALGGFLGAALVFIFLLVIDGLVKRTAVKKARKARKKPSKKSKKKKRR